MRTTPAIVNRKRWPTRTANAAYNEQSCSGSLESAKWETRVWKGFKPRPGARSSPLPPPRPRTAYFTCTKMTLRSSLKVITPQARACLHAAWHSWIKHRISSRATSSGILTQSLHPVSTTVLYCPPLWRGRHSTCQRTDPTFDACVPWLASWVSKTSISQSMQRLQRSCCGRQAKQTQSWGNTKKSTGSRFRWQKMGKKPKESGNGSKALIAKGFSPRLRWHTVGQERVGNDHLWAWEHCDGIEKHCTITRTPLVYVFGPHWARDWWLALHEMSHAVAGSGALFLSTWTRERFNEMTMGRSALVGPQSRRSIGKALFYSVVRALKKSLNDERNIFLIWEIRRSALCQPH